MKKAIGDNMIRKEWGFEKGLDLVKQAGFDGIELWLGDVPWFQLTTADAEVRELRRKIEIAGLVTEEVPYNEVYQRCVEALRPLGEQAARAGVRIGCENCNAEHRFLISPREFWQFLNDVNSPAVGIHPDVGNIHDTGFAEQWIEIHGPRITRIHLKDVLKHRGRSGDQSVYTNLFLGDNNWPAIRGAMTKVGYDGWLIAEMEARYRYAADQQFVDTSQAMDRLISGKL